MLVEMHKFNESFSKLQAEISGTKQVNTLLSSRLVSIERHCWLNAQYSRWECLDIVGIPSEVEADALEEKVVAIFWEAGMYYPDWTHWNWSLPQDHEKEPNCHCQVFAKKGLPAGLGCQKRLAKNKDGGYWLADQNKLFTNKTLYTYYKLIWAKSKKLHSLGKIHCFFYFGWHKIKVSENSSPAVFNIHWRLREILSWRWPVATQTFWLINSRVFWLCDAVIAFYTCILIDHQRGFRL